MDDAAVAIHSALHLKLNNDVKIVVPNNIENYATYVLLEQNDWFEDEIDLVRKFIRPGMNVIDIGANHGFYSLPIADLVGVNGNVWAFEPNPKIVTFLNASKSDNKFQQLHPMCLALSNKVGDAFLSDRGHDVLNQVYDHSPSESHIKINTQTLDGLANTFGGNKIDFVKIDAEGHESRIIEGGLDFFTNHSPLIMLEIKHDAGFDYQGMDMLVALGYRAYRYTKSLGVMLPFFKSDTVDAYTLNIFCCKDNTAMKLANNGLLSKLEDTAFLTNLEPHVTWRDTNPRLPYSSALVSNWMANIDRPAPAWDIYEKAINLFYSSRDKKNVVVERRYQMLEQAVVLLSQVIQLHATLPRIFTVARVALEVGQRHTAYKLMRKAAELLIQTGQSEIREPFLPALPRYDDIEIGSSVTNWMLNCALEGIELVGCFTSFIVGRENLSRLDYLAGNEFSTPTLKRRWALARYRWGVSDQLEYPSSRLTANEDTNYELWNAIKDGEIHLMRAD